VLWHLGYPVQAVLTKQRLVLHSEELQMALPTARALRCECFLGVLGADPVRARGFAEKALKHSADNSLIHFEGWARALYGALLIRTGDPQTGLRSLYDALNSFEKIGSRIFRSSVLGYIAEAHGVLHEPETGLSVLDEALTFVDTMSERHSEAELLRIQGNLLHRVGKSAEAEMRYQCALKVAREQQARWWELKAATDLARLWRDQGKSDEARELLAPVYGWFTEGFDLADMKAAKGLLDELGADAGSEPQSKSPR
jgi:predicted ATPase